MLFYTEQKLLGCPVLMFLMLSFSASWQLDSDKGGIASAQRELVCASRQERDMQGWCCISSAQENVSSVSKQIKGSGGSFYLSPGYELRWKNAVPFERERKDRKPGLVLLCTQILHHLHISHSIMTLFPRHERLTFTNTLQNTQSLWLVPISWFGALPGRCCSHQSFFFQTLIIGVPLKKSQSLELILSKGRRGEVFN